MQALMLVNRCTGVPEGWEETLLPRLVPVQDRWNSREILLEANAARDFERLRQALLDEGIRIEPDSGFRSVVQQQTLWDRFVRTCGAEYTARHVAPPGHSEHHTGYAIDIALVVDGRFVDDNDALSSMTELHSAIRHRLAEFGFLLRYPEGKEAVTGYPCECWHLRWVGDAAPAIARENLTLEEYLAGRA